MLPRRLVHAVARGAPRIEPVDADPFTDLGLLVGDTRQVRALSREHLLAPGDRRDLCLAFADDDGRARTVGGHVDPVQAGTRERDLARRRVDANGIVVVQHAPANYHAAGRDEERELAIVEARHMQARVAGEPELTAAVIDFHAAFGLDAQIVAFGDRVVEAELAPLAGADEHARERRQQSPPAPGRAPAARVVVALAHRLVLIVPERLACGGR